MAPDINAYVSTSPDSVCSTNQSCASTTPHQEDPAADHDCTDHRKRLANLSLWSYLERLQFPAAAVYEHATSKQFHFFQNKAAEEIHIDWQQWSQGFWKNHLVITIKGWTWTIIKQNDYWICTSHPAKKEYNRVIDPLAQTYPSWQDDPKFKIIMTASGEMAERTRKHDWASTSLGPIESWSDALIANVNLILSSKFPMSVYWGDELIVIYNDAYIPIVGPRKHPEQIFGLPLRQGWYEIWYLLEDLAHDAMRGKGCIFNDVLLMLDRLPTPANELEEAYVNWAYIPCWEPDATVGGILVPIYETGTSFIANRRLKCLRDLGTRLTGTQDVIDVCRFSCSVLAQLDRDLPFAMAYTCEVDEDVNGRDDMDVPHVVLAEEESKQPAQRTLIFTLQETIGCPFDCSAAPSKITIPLNHADGARSHHTPLPADGIKQWPLEEMYRRRECIIVEDVQHFVKDLKPRGFENILPHKAACIPLIHNGEVVGCFIFLLNPALILDATFFTFLDILGRQLTSSVTTAKMLEFEKQRADELRQLDEAKTAFFTSVSHELRTPLTLILGPTDELRHSMRLPSAALSQIDIIHRNAKRLLRLVNSILDFSKAEAGRMKCLFQATRIVDYTSALASTFRSAAEHANLDFDVQLNCSMDAVVWVDRDKWEKIIYNLLGNALKFTIKGCIRVTMEASDRYFMLSVKDSGIGIPANELANIFDKFHRVEATAGRHIEGTGIDLSLVLEFIKLHGGHITVDSVYEEGSTFKVFIPFGSLHLPQDAVDAESEKDPLSWGDSKEHAFEDFELTIGTEAKSAADTSELTDESPSSSGESWASILFKSSGQARPVILLVDDNADMRRYVRSILTRYCDVVECSDGQEAWELLHHTDVDLILSDWMMPRLSGPGLLALVRNRNENCYTPFILLSARAGEQERIEGLAATADDYLAKPFSAKELLLRVHSHVQLGRMRKDLELRVKHRTLALMESQASFKRLTEMLQVGVHRSDTKGKVIWANQTWQSFLELAPNQFDMWHFNIDDRDREGAMEAYASAIQHQKGYTRELRLYVSNKEHVIMYDLRPEKSVEGEVTGYVGVFSDLTELRRLEKEHLEAERARTQESERNRLLQEQFIDVTCHELRNPLNAICNNAELVVDSLSKINQWLSDIHPAVAPHLRGSQSKGWDRIRQDVIEDMDALESIVLCSRHQKRIADDVLNISKISGNLITLVVSDFDPKDEMQSILRIFTHEMTARKLKVKFIVHPSYEKLAIESVRADPGRFGQVVINLLSNSIKFTENSEKKEITIALGVGPAPAIPPGASSERRDSKADAGEDVPMRDATIPTHLSLSPSSSPIISPATLADASGLSRPSALFDDLLPACTQVCQEEHIEKTDRIALHVAIADTGRGMTTEEQSRIFRRFAQASPKTYGEFGGTGLGLYISRKMVELQGGSITLQSEKDVGTIFRFYILADRSQHPASPKSVPVPLNLDEVLPKQFTERHETMRQTPPPPPEVPEKPVARILVVEDNRINQKVLCRLLNNLNCHVQTANNGQECVDMLLDIADRKDTENYFDLILMDLEMPVLDGLSATAKIREYETAGRLPSVLRIVAVSGNARQEYSERAKAIGMNGFLRKPYSKAEINAIVESYVSDPPPI